MGAHIEALDEGILVAPLDSRHTQVGFNLVSVQVCNVSFETHKEHYSLWQSQSLFVLIWRVSTGFDRHAFHPLTKWINYLHSASEGD